MIIQGNALFRKGDFVAAIKHYTVAHEIEPELPHYQLNLAASHLKLNEYVQSHVLRCHVRGAYMARCQLDSS
jgi:hypothetical protein